MEDIREERKLSEIEFYNNFQIELAAEKESLIIQEPFKIVIFNPGDDSFNNERGFFTTAHIYYKGQLFARICPNFNSYGKVEFSDDRKFSFTLGNIFKELSEKIMYLLSSEGNGMSRKEEEKLSNFFRDSYFQTLQGCIDKSKKIQERIYEELSCFLDSSKEYKKYDPFYCAYVSCYDRYKQELCEGEYVDVQNDGPHLIYKKSDGQLYFKPYGQEDMVSSYFSNDIVKCDENGEWIVDEETF